MNSALSSSPTPTDATAAPSPAAPPQRASRRLSCVIPGRNEASNLTELLPQMQEVLEASGLEWEIIVVDDGSTDDTPALLREWTQRPGCRAIQFSRNFGKEAALTAGLQAARGDAVLTMDSDLQHSPQLVSTLIAHWRAGADVVYAVRANRNDESAFKRMGARWFYALVNGSNRFTLPAHSGDFRLMDRAAVDALLALPERNRFMKGLYAWIGFDAIAVPYVPEARAHGRTHFSPLRLMHMSIDGLTAFTTWPLRAVSVLGLVMALGGFVYGAFLTISYFLWGNDVSGWTTIVVVMLLFMGMQMIALGILGEYVGRIFEEVKARPIYIVRRELGRGLPPPDGDA